MSDSEMFLEKETQEVLTLRTAVKQLTARCEELESRCVMLEAALKTLEAAMEAEGRPSVGMRGQNGGELDGTSG